MIFTIPPPTPKLPRVAQLRENTRADKSRAHDKPPGSKSNSGATSGLSPPPLPPSPQREEQRSGESSKEKDSSAPVTEKSQSLAPRQEQQEFSEKNSKEEVPCAPAAEQSQIPPPQGEKGSQEGHEQQEGSVTTPPPPEPQFLVQDHKLGVSAYSLHALVNEARGAFPSARREYQRARRNLRANSDSSGGREQHIQKHKNNADTPDCLGSEIANGVLVTAASRLFSVTRALLLINADHGSAWNARKEVVQDGLYGSVRDEIKVYMHLCI